MVRLGKVSIAVKTFGVCDFSRLAVTDWRLRRWRLRFLALMTATHSDGCTYWAEMLFLARVLAGVRRTNVGLNKAQSPTTNIPALRRLHRDIHSALQKLQTAYGGPLTIGFSVAIINTVMAVFDLRSEFKVQSVMWVAWCAVTTWLMVMPCQLLLDKVCV